VSFQSTLEGRGHHGNESNDFGRNNALEGRTINGTTFVEPLHRLHWGGILAGSLTGLVTYIALGALGVAIGFGAAANLSDIRGLSGIGIGGAIWLVISLGAASFLAGLVSARASTDLNMARGRFNGVMTGIVMCAVLTLVTLSGLSSLATNVANTASNVVNAATAATTAGAVAAGNDAGGLEGIANRLGLGDELQALQNGLSRNEIAQIIADGSPELNTTQVDAAAATIESIVNNASRNLGAALSDPSNIGNIVKKQADAIGQALQGDQFSSRLQRRGLSKAQADEVVTVVSARVTELRQQAVQTAEAVQAQAAAAAKTAAAATASAIWVWLFAVGVTLAAATFGGGIGATDKSVVKATVVNT
jgi:hypothetical protein